VTDVRAVLVFDAEQGPHASSEDFRKSHEEGSQGRMLELEVKNGIENPVEAQNRVDHYSKVVHPYFLIAQSLSEERMFGTRITETPVVVDVPETAVDGIDGGKRDEHGAISSGFVDAVDAECHVEEDRCCVLAHVEQMREGVSGVVVTAETLYCSPYARERGKETNQSRV
jgi:hypothetical protein